MSDITKQRRTAKPSRAAVGNGTAGAAARVLAWLEQHIRDGGLRTGDALPGELEIAKAATVGRSSVREALTALKVLGIIQSRRKGGIRLVRDPVLLELRHYFAARLATQDQHTDAMEFRAALEWGLGPLMLNRVTPGTIRELRRIVKSVATQGTGWGAIGEAEVHFHTTLTAACGNRLAMLFAHVYEPIFQVDRDTQPTAAETAIWVRDHGAMVDALSAGDDTTFLQALRQHTHGYMRLRPAQPLCGGKTLRRGKRKPTPSVAR